MTFLLLLILLITPFAAYGELPLGKIPPQVILRGESGGRTDGSSWNSKELKDRIYALFYIDPDKKDLNEKAFTTLKKAEFSGEKFGSIAIINMGATWIPDMLLDAMLKKKQKEYPRTIYVKDMKKVIVKKWKLADNSSDVVVFDRNGKVLFCKDGKLTQDDINLFLETIRKNLE